MSDTYSHISRVLQQEDSDPVRLNQHTSTIISDTLPILEALEADALGRDSQHGLPAEWLESCAVALGQLLVETMSAAGAANQKDDVEVEVPSPVTVIHTGRPGRPRKVVNLEYLQEATSTHRAIPITKLANVLKIHRHTLEHEIERNGVTRQFAALSDCDLDRLVKVFKSTKPDSGICYLVGFLRYHGLRVQRKRVIHSVK
ncbi:hypothetical protein PILCRDRAFT_118051 [Piloderma croceum F 1598]|uniref:Uncharacterized protein n=1 Tax=Piloderma croceum (strain F 1598) TaxID=765440 RepID=A0A0C3GL47_PILCF|nr:hypothetical protein PILCRDRAFT_118051 [Piloderma croceum F 1598]